MICLCCFGSKVEVFYFNLDLIVLVEVIFDIIVILIMYIKVFVVDLFDEVVVVVCEWCFLIILVVLFYVKCCSDILFMVVWGVDVLG